MQATPTAFLKTTLTIFQLNHQFKLGSDQSLILNHDSFKLELPVNIKLVNKNNSNCVIEYTPDWDGMKQFLNVLCQEKIRLCTY